MVPHAASEANFEYRAWQRLQTCQEQIWAARSECTQKKAGYQKDHLEIEQILCLVPISMNELEATYIPEKLCPPPPGDATIPPEQLKAVETSLSQSSQADHLASPASPIDQPMQSCESNPPYAVLSMFDGCGSSLDILIEKFGYRSDIEKFGYRRSLCAV